MSKNYHADEKDEKSISNTIYLRLNKVFLVTVVIKDSE